jgi:hypothetical protein
VSEFSKQAHLTLQRISLQSVQIHAATPPATYSISQYFLVNNEWQIRCCSNRSMATDANRIVSGTHCRAGDGLAEKLNIAVKSAASALTQNQWQPWKFRIADRCVELFAEDGTFATVLDPDGRETIIRCGAALQSLKLALKHQGCPGRVELFPTLDEPDLVARVHVAAGGPHGEHESSLFNAMTPPSVTLLPPGNWPVPGSTLSLLSDAVSGDRAWLELAQSQASRGRLWEMATADERSRARASAVRCEVEPAFAGSGNESGRPDGTHFNEHAAGPRKRFLRVKLRASDTVPFSDTVHGLPESETLAVVKTKTDDKRGWVAAGQTVALLILTARAMGVSCAFFDNALRKAAVREELRTGVGRKGYAQAIAQLGAAGNAEFLQVAPGPVATVSRDSLCTGAV